jgi:hypothetical protein
MAEKEKLEEQIGEVLGLEMAAQKAVEELSTKGLLDQGGLSKSCKDLHSLKVWISKALDNTQKKLHRRHHK